MYNYLPQKIRIGVSGCLVGQKVRFDGGHKKSRFIVDDLAQFVELSPFCPEMGIGLGTPRPTIQLRKNENDKVIAITSTGQQVHEQLEGYFGKKSADISKMHGIVVTANSPSCGMERVRVYDPKGKMPTRDGQGIFTAALMKAYPNIPIEEDGRLNDKHLRENFVARVFAYSRWTETIEDGLTAAKLVEFHSHIKYTVMGHCPQTCKKLGKLVAHLNKPITPIADQYIKLLMQAMKRPISRKNHTNVLYHLHGYFKDKMSPAQRQNLVKQIDAYRLGKSPLMAPISLIKHHLAENPNPYIESQHYLSPYPEELSLRYGI